MYKLEANLQFVWERQLFNQSDLRTEDGQRLDVLFPGYLNRDSGPDFKEAKVRIGDVLFVGNVELHLKTSDWLKHGHQNDLNYQNIILHVILEADVCPSIISHEIPHLSIKKYLLLDEYKVERLRRNKDLFGFHCRELVSLSEIASQKIFDEWKWSLVEQRFMLKRDHLYNELKILRGDVRQWVYQVFARVFGKPLNTYAMEYLSRMVPITKLGRLPRDLFHYQVVFFGLSGLLDQYSDESYFKRLSEQWALVKYKYVGSELSLTDWKYFRLRPYGFPDRRLAQFAALNFHRRLDIDELLAFSKKQDAYHYLGFNIGAEWKGRCRVNKMGIDLPLSTDLSLEFKDRLIINAIIPVMMVLAKYQGQPLLAVRAFEILETLTAERNVHQRAIRFMGIQTKTALDTQAALMLRERYCKKYQCLKCQFWADIN